MADDELNQTENLAESPPGDQNPPEVEELEQSAALKARVTELEGLASQKDEEISLANARITELEQAVATRDSETVTLKQSMVELDERMATINDSLAEAVASYKAMVVQANPDVIEELISGDTIESINESLTEAKTLVGKVRQGLEAEISLARVPAGAPQRTLPDLSALSPREKIQYAIGGNK